MNIGKQGLALFCFRVWRDFIFVFGALLFSRLEHNTCPARLSQWKSGVTVPNTPPLREACAASWTRGSIRVLRSVLLRGALFIPHKFDQIARLAIQYVAYAFKRGESDGLYFPRFDMREIRLGNAYHIHKLIKGNPSFFHNAIKVESP